MGIGQTASLPIENRHNPRLADHEIAKTEIAMRRPQRDGGRPVAHQPTQRPFEHRAPKAHLGTMALQIGDRINGLPASRKLHRSMQRGENAAAIRRERLTCRGKSILPDHTFRDCGSANDGGNDEWPPNINHCRRIEQLRRRNTRTIGKRQSGNFGFHLLLADPVIRITAKYHRALAAAFRDRENPRFAGIPTGGQCHRNDVRPLPFRLFEHIGNQIAAPCP